MENRHAFLLMLHETYEQAALLITLLNQERNDLYVHIDGKVRNPEQAKTFIRDVFQRAGGNGALIFADSVKVTWGAFSQILAELSLLEKAALGGGGGDYAYYHLISGNDLPLLSWDDFYARFEQENGRQYISADTGEWSREVLFRYDQYHPFQEILGNRRGFFWDRLQAFQIHLVNLQKKLHISRTKHFPPGFRTAAGSNWFSITDAFARYVLEKKDWIRKTFHMGLCVDEIFLQVLYVNSAFFREEEELTNLRYIKWTPQGKVITLTANDEDDLIRSGAAFARKFIPAESEEIMDIISKRVKGIPAKDNLYIRDGRMTDGGDG